MIIHSLLTLTEYLLVVIAIVISICLGGNMFFQVINELFGGSK